MRRILFVMIAMLAIGLAGLVSGCGGEGGATRVIVSGVYAGTAVGDGTGPIKFYIAPNGAFSGNAALDPICGGPIALTGTVDESGNMTFGGTGCGVTFSGLGTVSQTSPGVWKAEGTWTGSDGTSGTWSATRTGGTGSITL